MAVSYVSSGTNSATSGTAITVTQPASIAAGDVIVAVIHANGSGPTISDNNGANAFTDSGLGNRVYNASSGSYRIMHRVAGGSEPASYAWTTSENNRWCVVVSVYRGVDTTAIYDVAPTTTSEAAGSTTTCATNTITTLTNEAMVVALICLDSATTTLSATPGDSFNSRQNNSGEQCTGLADKAIAVAGLQGSVSWTSSTGNAYITNVLALKNASAAATITGLSTITGLNTITL